MRWLSLSVLGAILLGCAVALNAVDRTEMTVEGERLYLSGEITTQTADNFVEVLQANPQLKTVVLLTMEGSLDDEAMIEMGYVLRAAGLNTHLTAASEIYSGAVDLFLAGNSRTIAPGATLGVHAWSDGFGEATDYPRDAPEHQQNQRYTRDMLGSDDFYWFTLQAAPADEIHVMTPAEIARYGLATN